MRLPNGLAPLRFAHRLALQGATPPFPRLLVLEIRPRRLNGVLDGRLLLLIPVLSKLSLGSRKIAESTSHEQARVAQGRVFDSSQS